MVKKARTAKKDPKFAYTLAKGFHLLEAFAGRPPALGNKELCAITGMSKSNISRLTGTLCELGYLRPVPGSGKFSLGLGVVALAYPLLINLPIRRIARPLMQELAEKVHGVVNLGMRHQNDIVLVESCRKIDSMAARPEIGARRSIALWLGHVYLAGLPEKARQNAIDDVAGTPVDRAALAAAAQARIEELRKQRYCFMQSEHGMNIIAVPFVGSTEGETCLLYCLAEDAVTPKKQMFEEIAGRLLRLIHTVQDTLGIDTEAPDYAAMAPAPHVKAHAKKATVKRAARVP